MAYDAGDVEARLTLDRSDFITGMRQSRAEAEKFERDYEANAVLNGTEKVSTQVTTMQKRLDAMAKTYNPTIQVGLGKSLGQMTTVSKRLTALGQKKAKPSIEVQDGKTLEKLMAISAAFKEIPNKLTTKVVADTAAAYKSLFRLNASIDRLTRDRTINIRINTPKMGPLNKALATMTKNPTIDANINPFIRKVQMVARAVDAMGKHTTYVKIDAKADVAGARTDLMSMWLLARDLNRQKVDIKVNARGFAGFIKSLNQAQTAQDGASNASDRHTRRIIAMTTAIIGLGAPALGLLASLLLTLPTVALMAGAAIGSIALGMDGIKQAAKTLTPEVDRLKASLNATWARELTPVFKELAAVFPVLQAGLNGQAVALSGWAAAFTNVVASAQGIQQLNIIFTNLNNFITSLTPSVTNMTEAFMTLGVVGTQNLWALSGALNGWTAGFNAMIQQAAQTGLLAQAFQQLGFVVGALLGLLNQLFQSGMQMMAALGPDLTTAINSLSNAFKALTPALITLGSWFLQLVTFIFDLAATMANDLGPILPALVAGFIGLYVAIQAVALITKAYAGAVVLYNGIMTAWKVVTAAATIVQWGLNAALLANPVGIVVAAVILLIAAVVALGYGIYKLIQNWDTVSAALSKGWQWLVDLWYSIWTPIVAWFSGIWESIKTSVSNAVTSIGTFFTGMWDGLVTGLDNAGKNIALFFENLPSKVAQWLGYVYGSIFKWGMSVANWFQTEFPKHMSALGTWFETLPDRVDAWLIATATSFYNSAKTWIGDVIRGMRERDAELRQWFIDLPGNVWNWLSTTGVQFYNGAVAWISDLIRGMRERDANIRQWFIELPGKIVSWIAGAATWLYNAGADIINGLILGLTNSLNAVGAFFGRMADSIKLGFMQAMGIASPSTVFAQYGVDLLQGLINGIQSMIQSVVGAIQFLTDSILGIIQSFISVWNTVISGIGDVFVLVFTNIYNFGVNQVQNLVNLVIGLIQNWYNFWTSTLQNLYNFFAGVITNIRNFAESYVGAMVQFMTTTIQGFQQFWNTVWNAISSFFQGIWNAMEAFGRTVLNAMITFYQQGLSGFGQFWNTIWQAILTFFSQIWQQIQTTAITIWNAINQFLTTALNAFFAFFQNIWQAILAFFAATWNNIFTTAQTAWNNINTFFQGAFAAFTAFFTSTWTNIVETFRRIWTGIIAIADGVWNSVVDAFVRGINFVIGIINKFADAINKVASLVGVTLNLKIDPISRATGGPIEVPGFATGGHHAKNQKPGRVSGRGTSTSDSILTRLSKGEHVWSKKEVDAAGGHEAVKRMRATMLNRGRNIKESMAKQAAPNMAPVRQSMAMQAAQAAPRDLGSGVLDGLKRFKMMEQNPIMDDYGVPGLAYGGVKPWVAAAGQEAERLFGRYPGGIGGVGARSGASDHPSGHALDFMTLSNVGLGERTANHFLQNAGRLAVKYVIWRQRINSGSGWRGMENRGSPTANHMDHPHVSFLPRPGVGGPAFDPGGAGGGGFFVQLLKPLVEAGLAPVRAAINGVGNQFGFPGQLAAGAINKILDGIVAKATAMDTAAMSSGASDSSIGAPGVGGGGAVERWRPLVIAALQRQGQPTDPATVNRVLMQIRSESGGNPNAVNNWDINARRGTPSGGLLQTIAPTFARYRDPGLPNNMFDPFANINASIRYALARYGSLTRAYRGVGYDDGGILPKGLSMVGNFTNDNEQMAVFDNEQWAALLNSADLARDIETMANEYITNNNTSGIDAATLQAILQQVMAGQSPLSITANLPQGTTVKQLVQELLFQKRHSERGVYS